MENLRTAKLPYILRYFYKTSVFILLVFKTEIFVLVNKYELLLNIKKTVYNNYIYWCIFVELQLFFYQHALIRIRTSALTIRACKLCHLHNLVSSNDVVIGKNINYGNLNEYFSFSLHQKKKHVRLFVSGRNIFVFDI